GPIVHAVENVERIVARLGDRPRADHRGEALAHELRQGVGNRLDGQEVVPAAREERLAREVAQRTCSTVRTTWGRANLTNRWPAPRRAMIAPLASNAGRTSRVERGRRGEPHAWGRSPSARRREPA